MLIRLGLLAAVTASVGATDEETKPTERKPPKIRVSKQTTFVLKPVKKDGFIDYTKALNSRLSNGVTAKNNAAIPIVRILGPAQFPRATRAVYFAKLGIKPLPDKGKYFVTMRRYAEQEAGPKHQEYVNALYAEYQQAVTRPWSPREFKKLAGWLKANRKHLDASLVATRRPRWFSPIVTLGEPVMGAVVPLTQEMQSLHHGLLARAMQLAQEGESEEALLDLLGAQRLARLVAGRFPIDTIVSYRLDGTVQTAVLALLRSQTLTDGELAQYQKSLDALSSLASMTESINFAERTMTLEVVGYVFEKGFGGLNDIAIQTDDRFQIETRKLGKLEDQFFRLVDWNAVLIRINRDFNRIRDALAKPKFSSRKTALDLYASELKKRRKSITTRHANMMKSVKNRTATRDAVSRHLADLILSLVVVDAVALRRHEDTANTRANLTRIAVALER